ncbi:hypothetical protein ACIBED_00350 [Rhodococcus coprophilus]|uniref:Uncharacterized protein n=1 Tax=Rhodococcus coprophilus TaxID=38310 RepID=A0A2X4TRR1_9NOCA|nr:hypothetical protein [Rhodococcus coprophilus]MBM7461524.1 hypothetical protein [Rhodococcus coprophilus]SQI29533.1 Uncharacterised protein [Rhodococcus coprophilus]
MTEPGAGGDGGARRERLVRLDAPADRTDLATFLTHALRLDDAAVVRLRRRGDGLFGVWTQTGFDVLASRLVRGTVAPADTCVAADGLRAAVVGAPGAGIEVDPGWAMDSAWRGALPPDDGFAHVDDIPARVLVELAHRGVALSREHGAQGPPASLLAQEVLEVSGGDLTVGVPMRMVFALGAMGFVPTTSRDAGDLEGIDPAEVVRVRASATWLRLDARYGSVHLRRGGGLGLSVV